MRKSFKSASVASALTILSLVATAGPVSANRVHPVHPAGHVQTLRIFEHLVNEKNVKVVKGKDQRGNIIVFYNPVFDSTDRKQIGHTSGSCFYTTNVLEECSWSFILPKGNISIEGPQVDDQDTVSAVTGGTGIYKLARGQAKIHVIKKKGFLDYKYDIQLVK
jgi:hypothetical protein